MSTTVPFRDEIFNAFEFTQADIQVPPIRPSGVTIQKLIKGFQRNARNQYSSRQGCKGAEIGHKWICMTTEDWDAEQSILASPTFDPIYLGWQAHLNNNPTAEWLQANPEPTIDNYTHPYPVIENPGEMDDWGGTAPNLWPNKTATKKKSEDSNWKPTSTGPSSISLLLLFPRTFTATKLVMNTTLIYFQSVNFWTTSTRSTARP